MREPSAREVVAVWERGSSQSLGERGLVMLALAEDSEDLPTTLHVGSRDAALFRIRRRYFGDGIDATADCGVCGEQLEVALSVSELLDTDLKKTAASQVSAEYEGVTVTCRLPTAADVLALRGVHDVDEGVGILLRRCLADTEVGEGRPPHEFAPDLVDAIAEKLGTADPCGDLTLTLVCPACGLATEAIVDIAAFLWTEIRQLARGLLSDVHTIAQAYGWDERTILDMSGARRRLYLDLIET